MSADVAGISDFLFEKISSGIGPDRLVPLDEPGQAAYVDVEGSCIYLITIQEAQLVPAVSAAASPGEEAAE